MQVHPRSWQLWPGIDGTKLESPSLSARTFAVYVALLVKSLQSKLICYFSTFQTSKFEYENDYFEFFQRHFHIQKIEWGRLLVQEKARKVVLTNIWNTTTTNKRYTLSSFTLKSKNKKKVQTKGVIFCGYFWFALESTSYMPSFALNIRLIVASKENSTVD